MSYNFIATSAWVLGGGVTMKGGNTATAGAALSLCQGHDATGSLIGGLTFTSSAFELHAGNCGASNTTPFILQCRIP